MSVGQSDALAAKLRRAGSDGWRRCEATANPSASDERAAANEHATCYTIRPLTAEREFFVLREQESRAAAVPSPVTRRYGKWQAANALPDRFIAIIFGVIKLLHIRNNYDMEAFIASLITPITCAGTGPHAQLPPRLLRRFLSLVMTRRLSSLEMELRQQPTEDIYIQLMGRWRGPLRPPFDYSNRSNWKNCTNKGKTGSLHLCRSRSELLYSVCIRGTEERKTAKDNREKKDRRCALSAAVGRKKEPEIVGQRECRARRSAFNILIMQIKTISYSVRLELSLKWHQESGRMGE